MIIMDQRLHGNDNINCIGTFSLANLPYGIIYCMIKDINNLKYNNSVEGQLIRIRRNLIRIPLSGSIIE